jgi:uncharacterized RDD family membrane protein YckC
LKSFFLTKRLFLLLAALIAGLVVAFFWPVLLAPMQVSLGLLVLLTLLDVALLYLPGSNGAGQVFGRRVLGEKLANGSDNDVAIFLE